MCDGDPAEGTQGFKKIAQKQLDMAMARRRGRIVRDDL
jgi:hypothetical protein